MIKNIRSVERSISPKLSSVSNSEKAFTQCMRSVVSSKDINAGEKITIDNITTKRPALPGCVSAQNFWEVQGLIAAKDIKKDNVILWSDLNGETS